MINNVVYNILLICEVEIYLSSYNFETDKLELSLSCNAKQGSELEPYKVSKSVQLRNHVLQKQRHCQVIISPYTCWNQLNYKSRI